MLRQNRAASEAEPLDNRPAEPPFGVTRHDATGPESLFEEFGFVRDRIAKWRWSCVCASPA